MIDGIPAVVGLASPLGATIAIFYLVFTGRLIPRSSHNDVVRVLENRNAEVVTDRQAWRAASEQAAATNGILVRTNAELIETAKVTKHVMAALQENAGGAHVLSMEKA